jgi:hypothetical protein
VAHSFHASHLYPFACGEGARRPERDAEQGQKNCGLTRHVDALAGKRSCRARRGSQSLAPLALAWVQDADYFAMFFAQTAMAQPPDPGDKMPGYFCRDFLAARR